MRRRRQTSDRLVLAEVTGLHGPEDGVELIHLYLAHVDLTQEIACKGLEVVCSFDQPVQHGIGIDLKDPRGGAYAQALGQASQNPHDQLHGAPCAMKERAMGIQKVAPARGTVELPTRATTRMAIGAQVARAQPAS